MMSARYAAIVALMDDPLNRVCMERELRRRQIRFALKHGGGVERYAFSWNGGKNGDLVYTTFRFAMHRTGNGSESPEDDDIILHVWEDPNHQWWVSTQEGDEIGPFDSRIKADTEARHLFVGKGWKFIDDWPWDIEDLEKWGM